MRKRFGFGFDFDFTNLDGSDVGPPSKIYGDTDTARSDGVLPNDLSINFATYVAQMGKLGKVQTQSGVFVNKECHSIPDQLQGRTDPDDEGRWRGIGTFTFIRLAATASFARMTGMAVSMQSTDATGRPQHAGRHHRGLMHSIDCYQWFGHKYPHEVKQGAGLFVKPAPLPAEISFCRDLIQTLTRKAAAYENQELS